MFRFKDHIFYSKVELVGYLVKSLGLTDKDLIIIDRTTDIGQVILENASQARTAIVIHADHYSKNNSDDSYILWNNYYEYPFDMADHIDYYIASTDMERDLLKDQFRQYIGKDISVVTIPAGGLGKLYKPQKKRKPFSIITASRLASEKHIDWIIKAVREAKKDLPELTLDIYGQGENYKLLKKMIGKDHYIRLMGQHDMTLVYRNYELYLAGSTSEGFGLSLMEAVGSGLPIIGFDVPYGNPAFVDEGENGYLISYNDTDTEEDRIRALASAVVKYFKESDMEKFHEHSYEKASYYLVDNLSKRWKEILN
jgi:accessory Sec system glycosylation protein GtfA